MCSYVATDGCPLDVDHGCPTDFYDYDESLYLKEDNDCEGIPECPMYPGDAVDMTYCEVIITELSYLISGLSLFPNMFHKISKMFLSELEMTGS